MIYTIIKSTIFYIIFSFWTVILGIVLIPFLFLPKDKLYGPIYIWISGIFFFLRIICNVSYKIIGKNFIENTLYDLEKWDTFEKENPKVFAGMYQFWCQKV